MNIPDTADQYIDRKMRRIHELLMELRDIEVARSKTAFPFSFRDHLVHYVSKIERRIKMTEEVLEEDGFEDTIHLVNTLIQFNEIYEEHVEDIKFYELYKKGNRGIIA